MLVTLKSGLVICLLVLGLVLQACASAVPANTSALPVLPSTLPSLPGMSTNSHELKGQVANWLTLDDTHIYWTTNQDPLHIYRVSLAGGDSEIIATSQYSDGDLSGMRPIRMENWLVFLDTPLSSDYKTWAVRALDLTAGKSQVLIEAHNDEASWPGPMVDGYGHELVWSQTKSAQDSTCVETILATYDLTAGAQQEIDRTCIEDNYLWSNPKLSDGKIVVEQDVPDARGGGNNIFLYDRQSQTFTKLTENSHGSMPVIADSWIVWKDALRFEFGKSVMIYDQSSRTQYPLTSPAVDPLDPQLSGNWLYWPPSANQPFYVYDLIADQQHAVVEPAANEDIVSVAIHGDIAAWCRNLDFQTAEVQGSRIEWRVLPQ